MVDCPLIEIFSEPTAVVDLRESHKVSFMPVMSMKTDLC